ncbi:hypothetical protein RBG61_07730 [Paludicola sp. MB14-C6]|uniref:hypothetical protein n=1 Tax=Paludihabitans sp. MB14-C6 TaxID=3070656 RepID=UPI0027DC468F|nr:hypothetical protein [Paludicola sp. MB14-C6]WMJ21892.1 hypothetical protein RBG61_07730 [Paludicola sp. MB14-C6]
MLENNRDNNTSNAYQKAKKISDSKCPYYVNPCEIVAVAAALSLLLGNNLETCQISTLVNLLNVLSQNLSSIVVQREINSGQSVIVESTPLL